jgi:capsular exopolysaccharide synthesis family protein
VLTAATLFGGILATFADRSDSRIKTLAQLNEISGLPTLAIIPQVGIRERARRARPSRDDLKRYDPDLKVLLPPALQPPLMRYAYDDPTSTFADGIRAIRLAVQRAHETAKSDVVMVTSASDSEGKSTLSTNLARSFAMAGVHTVLVDCDLRNPEVTNSLCPRVERGLTDLTSENYTVEQCILDEEVSGLSILPAPPSRDFTRRTEFAFSPQFSDVLTQLRKRFDLIILDAPPLIPLTDSRALADHADNIIVTAAWNQTRQDVLAEGLLLLEPNLHRVVGCVLSRVDMDRIRYYDSFYGEAYREPYRPSW